jgi:hypothetical protein
VLVHLSVPLALVAHDVHACTQAWSWAQMRLAS